MVVKDAMWGGKVRRGECITGNVQGEGANPEIGNVGLWGKIQNTHQNLFVKVWQILGSVCVSLTLGMVVRDGGTQGRYSPLNAQPLSQSNEGTARQMACVFIGGGGGSTSL